MKISHFVLNIKTRQKNRKNLAPFLRAQMFLHFWSSRSKVETSSCVIWTAKDLLQFVSFGCHFCLVPIKNRKVVENCTLRNYLLFFPQILKKSSKMEKNKVRFYNTWKIHILYKHLRWYILQNLFIYMKYGARSWKFW